ncbi:hypothetical protein BJY16_003119 [Actinoplanes octamycinicus]|uniref:Uncharacterized protein n=1 Tax=Actinoplanes octamycinicus TaxID=135948 RepID=A0A7W7GWP1_9ACTN|nr:hypothetical protein [Actinoplanes octamycinicus]MBB4739660.1 hypothetical protein [Actinoplanes octamycinicus]GIE54843.1 hypothetical protein Aoc01nite_02450 [Actinoplanes octamycinicus]
MDLHGCPRCGSVDVTWSAALVDRSGVMARRYSGPCGGCGEEREFVFALPERPTPPRPDAWATFGAAGETSQLFDAGEWVAVADMLSLAAGLTDTPEAEARQHAGIAVACLDEALKFLPEGAVEAPEQAFWSDQGRAFRARSPERFRRADLIERRAALAGRAGSR